MNPQPLLLPNGRDLDRVPLSNIVYIEVMDKLCKVVTTKQEYRISASLNSFLKLLSEPDFIKIHRNYVVALNHVNSIGDSEIVVLGKKLPVSRNNRMKLFSCFRLYR